MKIAPTSDQRCICAERINNPCGSYNSHVEIQKRSDVACTSTNPSGNVIKKWRPKE